MLTVSFGKVRTRIYLLTGVPVFATEGVLGDAIGRLLLELGLLDDAQYTAVLRHMIDHDAGQFAEVAAKLGFLSQEDVDDALRAQVRRKITHCMEWPDVQSDLVESEGALEDVPHYPVDPEALLVETAKRFWGPAETERVVLGMGSRYPQLRGEVDEVARSAELKPKEARLLELMDGSRTLDGVITQSPLDQLHALQIVAALSLLDEISWTLAPLQRVQAETVVVPGAVTAEPRRARSRPRLPIVRRASRRPPPAPAPPKPAAPAEPKAPSSAKARLIAELAFRRGKAAYRAGLLGKALLDLKRAAELDPEVIEYQLYALWTEHQTSKGWKILAALREKLADLVQAALAQDRNLAFAHHVQAHLYLHREEQDMALRAFRIAYKLDSNDVDSERHIRVLSRRK